MRRVSTAFGMTLMGLVLIVSLIRAGQKLASGRFEPAVVPSITATSATIGSDGVQHVSLSFGNFNYAPDTIRVKRGVPVAITGDTARLRGCFSTLVVPELNVWGHFTPQSNTITFTPTRTGTFRFSCAMGMGSGRVIVEA